MSEPTDKDLPDEQQLDEYLKGGSSVSQQYRQLRNDEVPVQLDRLVLRQAHDAVKKAHPAKSRVWMRWTAPLALAASAVLVVSIVIESGVQNDELVKPASAPAPPVPMATQAKRNSEAFDDDASASVAREAQHAPGFVPEAPRAMPEAAFDPSGPSTEATVSAQEPPQSRQVETPPAELRRERYAAPAPQASANDRPPVVEAEKAARLLSADAIEQTRIEETTAGDLQFTRGTQQRAAGPRSTVRPASAVAESLAAREESRQPQHYSDPELWLRDIRILRLQDQQEEADREWRRFRKAFPDHPVAQSDAARAAK